MKRKIIAVLLSAVMLTCMVGCTKQSDEAAEVKESKEAVAGEDKITYWVQMNPNVAPIASNYNDVEYFKNLQKETGVEVEFLHPPTGQSAEQFKLLIASRNDLPDVIETTWLTSYPGGPEKAIADGIIIDIAPYLEEFAPNYKKMIESDPQLLKQSKTDSGAVFGFHAINGSDSRIFGGFMLRQDWLTKFGLSVPETIDEWENVLTVFKDKAGATAPISTSLSSFIDHMIPAYNIAQKFYLENGKVQYGAITPQYKEFLMEMNQWYEKGLIDPDIASIDDKTIDANVLNDKSGATFGGIGGGMGKWLDSSTNPEFALVAAPFPTLEKGAQVKVLPASYSHKMRGTSLAITTSAKDVEKIVKWLDERYTEEGIMLRNFGVEGETYDMVDGSPVYKEIITDNPEGLSMAVALGKYTQAGYPSPGICEHPDYHKQYMFRPQQQEALRLYNKDVASASENMLPPIVATPDESKELANIVTELNTFIDESTIAFITGVEPIENFDKFVEDVKSMEVERAIEIQQAGVERYNAR